MTHHQVTIVNKHCRVPKVINLINQMSPNKWRGRKLKNKYKDTQST